MAPGNMHTCLVPGEKPGSSTEQGRDDDYSGEQAVTSVTFICRGLDAGKGRAVRLTDGNYR